VTADERELLIIVADLLHKLCQRQLFVSPKDMDLIEQLLRRVKETDDREFNKRE
jgi:hypothetical protein